MSRTVENCRDTVILGVLQFLCGPRLHHVRVTPPSRLSLTSGIGSLHRTLLLALSSLWMTSDATLHTPWCVDHWGGDGSITVRRSGSDCLSVLIMSSCSTANVCPHWWLPLDLSWPIVSQRDPTHAIGSHAVWLLEWTREGISWSHCVRVDLVGSSHA
jgi:hypothetical protein